MLLTERSDIAIEFIWSLIILNNIEYLTSFHFGILPIVIILVIDLSCALNTVMEDDFHCRSPPNKVF